MVKHYYKSLVCLFFLAPTLASAAVPAWQIVPSESSITFIATQNDAPVHGEFKTFTGVVNYDPAQLDSSNVQIVVDPGSVSDAYNALADTLKGKDWFNVSVFPKVTFTSTKFTKTSENAFQADGTLTIRDKTLPITLAFTQEEYSQTKIRIKGSTTIKRTAFGIGQGDWSNTSSVKDEVTVNFTVAAVKK
jgi:polyisoprenoid-binding protein YceI